MNKAHNHNQICTQDILVSVGREYDYFEDGMVCVVRVKADTSNDNGIGFDLEVTQDPHRQFGGAGRCFSIWAASGRYAYNGMWRIYNRGEYIRHNPSEAA